MINKRMKDSGGMNATNKMNKPQFASF